MTENLLKLAPPIIALVTTLLRQIPRAAVAARERENDTGTGLENMRVLEFTNSPAWQKWLYGSLTNEVEEENRLRKGAMRFTLVAGFIVLAATIAYLIVAASHHLPWWSYALAVALGLPAGVILLRRANQLGNESEQAEEASAPTGFVKIQGEPGDVQQFSLAGLRQIGARLTSAKRKPSGEWVIHAATGVALPGRIFLGELVKVTVEEAGECQKVTIKSRKVDWVTPSRATRNVSSFLELWATYSEKS